MKKTGWLWCLCCALVLVPVITEAREKIHVVGSSTVFPFSTSVAEHFGAKTSFSAPVVESTGSGGGLKLFCKGTGPETPDITNASRRIKASEWNMCHKAGVKDIVEVKIGFDGIVLANSLEGPVFDLTEQQIFQALAAYVPKSDTECTLIPNPYTLWSDIDPRLPAEKIEVFGPPPTSGTRDAFVEIAMEGGAESYTCLKDLKKGAPGEKTYDRVLAELPPARIQGKDGQALKGKKIFQSVAHEIREDGAWIDAGENDNAIVQTLVKNPSTIGVFGYSFLDQNGDRIKGAAIDEVKPDFEAIAEGDYPVSRSLYFYLKGAHLDLIPGLKDYVMEFTSEGAWGTYGYLADKGLIPLSEEARPAAAQKARDLVIMTAEDAQTLH